MSRDTADCASRPMAELRQIGRYYNVRARSKQELCRKIAEAQRGGRHFRDLPQDLLLEVVDYIPGDCGSITKQATRCERAFLYNHTEQKDLQHACPQYCLANATRWLPSLFTALKFHEDLEEDVGPIMQLHLEMKEGPVFDPQRIIARAGHEFQPLRVQIPVKIMSAYLTVQQFSPNGTASAALRYLVYPPSENSQEEFVGVARQVERLAEDREFPIGRLKLTIEGYVDNEADNEALADYSYDYDNFQSTDLVTFHARGFTETVFGRNKDWDVELLHMDAEFHEPWTEKRVRLSSTIDVRGNDESRRRPPSSTQS